MEVLSSDFGSFFVCWAEVRVWKLFGAEYSIFDNFCCDGMDVLQKYYVF
jgi:hypothetical protein